MFSRHADASEKASRSAEECVTCKGRYVSGLQAIQSDFTAGQQLSKVSRVGVESAGQVERNMKSVPHASTSESPVGLGEIVICQSWAFCFDKFYLRHALCHNRAVVVSCLRVPQYHKLRCTLAFTLQVL